ncbi:enterotoxin [Aeromonas hydrophila]|nr:enterotoxin [Aeromonas hydrophila]
MHERRQAVIPKAGPLWRACLHPGITGEVLPTHTSLTSTHGDNHARTYRHDAAAHADPLAQAETLSLEGDQYRIKVETDAGKFRELTFTNTANGDLIRSDNLFDIKGTDDRLTPSADFKVTAFTKNDDRIEMALENADFVVKSAIRLGRDKRYASIDFALDTLKNGKKINGFSMLPFHSQAPFVYGAINSSPIVSDSFFITPQNPLVNTRAYEGGVSQLIPLKLPLAQGKPLSYRTYVGTFGEGQLRRDFNRFLNEARDRPYAPYLHYNSWLDIGFFNPYTEAEALKRIDQFGEALISRRGVPMNGFLFDDGWDDRLGNWGFSKDFPNGFSKLKSAAERYHAQLGIWLSPWGVTTSQGMSESPMPPSSAMS